MKICCHAADSRQITSWSLNTLRQSIATTCVWNWTIDEVTEITQGHARHSSIHTSWFRRSQTWMKSAWNHSSLTHFMHFSVPPASTPYSLYVLFFGLYDDGERRHTVFFSWLYDDGERRYAVVSHFALCIAKRELLSYIKHLLYIDTKVFIRKKEFIDRHKRYW